MEHSVRASAGRPLQYSSGTASQAASTILTQTVHFPTLLGQRQQQIGLSTVQREHRRNHATGLQWIKVLIALIGVVAGVAPARSQDVPGPIRIIVTGPAGGTPDIIARTTGDRMSAVLGVPVVIENRTGGLGATSIAQQTASAEPDGRTLLQVNTSLFSIGPAIYRKAPFDVHKDSCRSRSWRLRPTSWW